MTTTLKQNSEDYTDEELDEGNTIHVYVPTSTTRLQVRAISEDIPEMSAGGVSTQATEKQRMLPLREKDAAGERVVTTRPVVEIPARKLTPVATTPRKGTSAGNAEIIADDEDGSCKGAPSARTHHRRFGSEELQDGFFSTARESKEGEHDGDDGDESPVDKDNDESEDDAPEAVGIQDAAQSIKSKDKLIAKAINE